eukprot:332258-Rhodomonas_salina.1
MPVTAVKRVPVTRSAGRDEAAGVGARTSTRCTASLAPCAVLRPFAESPPRPPARRSHVPPSSVQADCTSVPLLITYCAVVALQVPPGSVSVLLYPYVGTAVQHVSTTVLLWLSTTTQSWLNPARLADAQ